jgi:hypothetical protein
MIRRFTVTVLVRRQPMSRYRSCKIKLGIVDRRVTWFGRRRSILAKKTRREANRTDEWYGR